MSFCKLLQIVHVACHLIKYLAHGKVLLLDAILLMMQKLRTGFERCHNVSRLFHDRCLSIRHMTFDTFLCLLNRLHRKILNLLQSLMDFIQMLVPEITPGFWLGDKVVFRIAHVVNGIHSFISGILNSLFYRLIHLCRHRIHIVLNGRLDFVRLLVVVLTGHAVVFLLALVLVEEILDHGVLIVCFHIGICFYVFS